MGCFKDEPIVVKPDYKPAILTDEHYAYIVGREGGMIAPESDITTAEVATIIYSLLDQDERNKAKTRENVFTDVNEGDCFNARICENKCNLEEKYTNGNKNLFCNTP